MVNSPVKSSTIVIVGGGVIGLSTAYQLARRKAGRVVLLEKGTVGDGSSSRAAGITTGLLWSDTGIRARKIGLDIFRQLSDELDGYTYHDEHGCLNLFSPDMWRGREPLLPQYDRIGTPYDVFGADEISRRWPALHPPEDVIGLFDPSGGYSEPSEYIPALAERSRQLGVEVCEGEQVEQILVRGGRCAGVRTNGKTIEADVVISTVHVWSLALWAHLNLRLPMKSFVHQRYVSTPLPEPLSIPPVNANIFEGYVRPATGNRILLGTESMDRQEWKVDGTDFQMSKVAAPIDLRDRAVETVAPFLPALKDVGWESEHVGLLSFSCDGEPLLGPVKELPGLLVGASFHSGGFSYNTAVGLLLAEFVVDGKPRIDLSAFSPDRFESEEVDAFLSTTVSQSSAVPRRH